MRQARRTPRFRTLRSRLTIALAAFGALTVVIAAGTFLLQRVS